MFIIILKMIIQYQRIPGLKTNSKGALTLFKAKKNLNGDTIKTIPMLFLKLIEKRKEWKHPKASNQMSI